MIRLSPLIAVFLAACATPQKPAPVATVEQHSDLAEAGGVAEVGEFDFTTTEVKLTDIPLHGDLLRPVTDAEVPAALIVHDWDVTLRDGMIGASFGVGLPGEVPVYRGLAEGLAARGVAVLIFDKRNCAGGAELGGSCPPVEVEGRAGRDEDVRAALNWLQKQDGVANVSLIAHGAGSFIAVSEARSERPPKVRSLVLLHPMMAPVESLAKFQIEESLRLIDARIATVGDTPEADLLKQKRGELQSQLAAEDVLGVGPAGLKALGEDYARFVSRRSERLPPTLVIEAALDPGEPATEAKDRRDAFGEDRVQTIPELSRAMVSVGEDDDATAVSGEVVTRVSAFLRAPQ